jgi:hypothetical protein
MSALTNQATPQDDPGHPAAGAHNYAEVLHELITVGTDLARLLHEQATAQAQAAQQDPRPQPAPAPAPCAPVPDTLATITAAFNCTVRAVRRGILLAHSLARPIQPAPDPARHRADARKRILREVEDTIQRPGSDGRSGPALPADLQDSLRAELRDRLDSPDLDNDITGRPVADIITEIRRDLGLDAFPGTRPFARRTPDDIRQLCAHAAAPSAPRQPGAGPQEARPQDHMHGAAQRLPDSQPDKPAAISSAQPDSGQTGSVLPDDPADMIAMILRHPTRAHTRWRPPPGA